MAATKLIAMHKNQGKSIGQCLSARIDYAKDEDKTDDGRYVTSYACNDEIPAKEFETARQEYIRNTGREYEGDIIAYQIRQSFMPGEVTPEEANAIGYETAMRFTKGEHAFVCCTHIDKEHIHNHIIYNSVNLHCDRKFRDSWYCGLGLRTLSDIICLEHGLSVIEPYKNPGKRPKYEKSYRQDIRESIDKAVAENPKTFEDLLSSLVKEGYELKRGKLLAIRGLGRKNFVRFKSLGQNYSTDYLTKIIEGEGQNKAENPERHFDLLIDIQKKLRQGKGKGYARWGQRFNSKAMMNTLLFLNEKGIRSYDDLKEKADSSSKNFRTLTEEIKGIEGRIAEINDIRKHIINYSKTKDVYEQYRKAGFSPKFYEAHREELALRKAAQKKFDQLDGKIPKLKDLNREYSELMDRKKKCYRDYKLANESNKKLQEAKYNVETMLQLDTNGRDQQKERPRSNPTR